MPRLKIKIDRKAFGDATVRSSKMRELVAERTEAIAARARAAANGDEVETFPEQGVSRARGYVRRLGSGAAGEAHDGALSRSITE